MRRRWNPLEGRDHQDPHKPVFEGARVIQVIETTFDLRGTSPVERERGETVRRVTQLWTLDGQLLAEVDRYSEAGDES